MANDFGMSMLDGAPDSFLRCPQCQARARVIHREPHSGGGICRHEHHCTRCRHEWEAQPDTYLICPHENCDAHRRDRTGQAGHEERIQWLMTGPMPVDRVAAARILLVEFGADPEVAADGADAILEFFRGVAEATGRRPRVLAEWLHALNWKDRINPKFGVTPVTLFRTPQGRQQLVEYLVHFPP